MCHPLGDRREHYIQEDDDGVCLCVLHEHVMELGGLVSV